jgi:hypothetical protein
MFSSCETSQTSHDTEIGSLLKPSTNGYWVLTGIWWCAYDHDGFIRKLSEAPMLMHPQLYTNSLDQGQNCQMGEKLSDHRLEAGPELPIGHGRISLQPRSGSP